MEVTMTGPAPAVDIDQMDGVLQPVDISGKSDGGFDLLLAMALEAAPVAITTPTPIPEPPVEDPGAGASGAEMTPPTGVRGGAVAVQLAPAGVSTNGVAAQPPIPPAGATDVGGFLPAPPAAMEVKTAQPQSAGGTDPPEAFAPLEAADRASANRTVSGDQALTDHASVRAIASSGSSAEAGLGRNDAGTFTGSEGRAGAGLMERDGRAGQLEARSGGELPDEGKATFVPLAPDVRATASSIRTGAAHPTGPTLVPQLADGIRLAFERQGSAVRVQLSPEGLGSVDLRVTSGQAGLAIRIAVEDPATRDLIQAAVGQLTQTLESRGISVAHLLVDLAVGQGRQDGSTRQPSQQPSAAGQFRSGDLQVGAENDVPAAEGPVAAYRIDYRV